MRTIRNETGVIVPPASMLTKFYRRGHEPHTEGMPTIQTVDRFAMNTTTGRTATKQIRDVSAPITDTLRTISAGGNHAGLRTRSKPP